MTTHRLTSTSRLSLSGIGDARAAHAAVEHLAAGAGALASWGIAGGLDPALKPGDVLLPERVIFGGESYATDPVWRERIAGFLKPHFPIDERPLLHSQTPLLRVDQKREAWEATGASAVDMESGAVARIASLHKVPFICLRAVADPASRALPKSALAAASPEGGLRPIRLLASLTIRPWEIGALRALSRDLKAAQLGLFAAWIWAEEDLFAPPQSHAGGDLTVSADEVRTPPDLRDADSGD